MIELTLKIALDRYGQTFMASRNFAPRTRVEYFHDLQDLVQFLEAHAIHQVNRVSYPLLEQYLAELDRRGYAGSTRKRKFASLKSFFRFLSRDHLLTDDPTLHLSPPRAETHDPRVLSEIEYKQLLRSCAYEPRDAAIIELFLQTGIRLSELVKLTLDDVELPALVNHEPQNIGLLRVLGGKGRKDRTLPLNYKAIKSLKAYLRVRRKTEARQIFLNKFGTPLGPRGVQLLIRKYLEEAQIKGASVHSLRHTFGTHHVAKGTSLRSVQEALGHKDLKTTSIYVSLARDLMNKEFQEHAL